ncbi:MAG: ABC transporter permease, partial [Chloroflexota bacterium]|nr:ABC transporter permease [Chloroflexota bacterium]
MTRYVLRRAAEALPLLFGISVLLFAFIHLAPGGPEDVYLVGSSTMSASDAAAINRQLGLDDPPQVQYFKWLGGMVRGDWGRSFKDGRLARSVIFERLPASFELAGAAILLGLLVAIPAGIAMAVRSSAVERFV